MRCPGQVDPGDVLQDPDRFVLALDELTQQLPGAATGKPGEMVGGCGTKIVGARRRLEQLIAERCDGSRPRTDQVGAPIDSSRARPSASSRARSSTAASSAAQRVIVPAGSQCSALTRSRPSWVSLRWQDPQSA